MTRLVHKGGFRSRFILSLGGSGNLIIMVSDLDRSLKFYRDTLGLKATGGVAGEFAFLQWGGITLALRETDRPITKCSCEISFSTSDVRTSYDELKKKGIAFTQPLRAVTGNAEQEMLASDFRDPDGHILSISGWVHK